MARWPLMSDGRSRSSDSGSAQIPQIGGHCFQLRSPALTQSDAMASQYARLTLTCSGSFSIWCVSSQLVSGAPLRWLIARGQIELLATEPSARCERVEHREVESALRLQAERHDDHACRAGAFEL